MTRILQTLQSLPAEKRKALAVMMTRKGVDLFRDLPVTAVDRSQPLPLSYAQQRLWLVDQLEAEKGAYVVPGVFRLTGSLDPVGLEAALGDLLRRHEILRTRFPAADGNPLQVADVDPELNLRHWSVRDLCAGEREARIQAICDSEARAPFDLSTGPLVRCGLIEVDEHEHLLTLTLHHVVADGWSVDILLRDLGRFYSARVRGRSAALPDLEIHYADYALWQRFWMESGEAERQLQWWCARLGEDHAPIALPSDRPRPQRRSGKGGGLRLKVARDLAGRLAQQAERHRVTLSTVLLSALFVLLYRHGGQRRMVVGVPMAGRDRVEFESVVGLFVNTVPICAELDGRQSFAVLLAQIHAAFLEAQDHQALPFDLLVNRLQPERATAHSPLVQVLFNHISEPPAPVLEGLEVSLVHQPRPAPKMDLTLTIESTGDAGLVVELDYSADIFDAETVSALARRYCRFLEEVAVRPASRIGEVDLLGAEERRQLGADWPCPTPLQREAAPAPTFPELFAEQARRFPDKPALVQGDVALTYAELQRRSDGLAGLLLDRGVGPGDNVILAGGRTPETVVGLLAVMKAGAAVVPVDPATTASRLAGIADICGAGLVLSADPLFATGLPVLSLDLPVDAASEQGFRTRSVDARRLACVIFTSGSTGVPKGVAVSHGALAAYLQGVSMRLALAPDASMAMVSTMAADLGHTVLFGALASGRTLHLFDDETARDPLLYAEAVRHHGIGIVKAVPSHLESLLIPGREAEAMPRDALILGGEACRSDLLGRLRAAAPECRIINHYGPTEATVGVVADDIPTGPDVWESVPLGRPLPQAWCYVLDRDLNLVPPGVPGELCVAGDCLAQGYVAAPAATADRFVPNPFGGRGQRLYRTGDRVCWRADGRLHYLGRLDRQVKVRGFRVEPGEIEAFLSALPGVRQAVVVDQESKGEVRLVAYLALQNSLDSTALQAVERALKSGLPPQMQPAALVPIDAVPLTANGKIDRKALPAADLDRSNTDAALNTETERRIAEIWQEVLGVANVCADDGFFSLGGHSLSATHVVSRVRQAFSVSLPLRSLFESPYLKDFARAVDEAQKACTDGRELQAESVETPGDLTEGYPLSYAQERMWFFAQLEPKTAIYNIAAGLRLRGVLDSQALQNAFAALVGRHGALRTRFCQVDGEPRQFVEENVASPTARIDVSDLPPAIRLAAARRHAEEEARRPFDLEVAPLIRASLIRLSDRDHILLLTLHHIAADGWSIRVLTRDFQEIYRAERERRAPTLNPVPADYTQFAVQQHHYLESGAAQWQLAYWRRHLGTEHPVTTLPADGADEATNRLAVHHEFRLPVEATQCLRRFAARHQYTVFTLILAGFAVVLNQLTGERRLRFGGDIANRNDDRFTEVVGFFVNQLVLQIDVDPDSSIGALLDQCRRVVVDASEHQDLPFHHLVEALRPARRRGRSPFFNIKLIYQEGVHAMPDLPGLSVTPFPPGVQAAELELVVAVNNAPDGIQACFTVPEGLYRTGTIAAVFEQMAAVLEAMPAKAARGRTAELVAVAEAVRVKRTNTGNLEKGSASGPRRPPIRRVARSGATRQVS